MATATIVTNLGSLKWQSTTDTNITKSEDTTVTNSSGADVYWGVGSTTNVLKKGKSHLFTQQTATVIYDFSNTSGGAAQITLTLSGSSGGGTGSPVPLAQGESQPGSVDKQADSVIDEVEVEVKVKVKLKDGKVIKVE